MTIIPKNGLIMLILGITLHLNLGNIPTVSANQTNNHSKNFLLHSPYFSNSNNVEPFQQCSFLEKNLHIKNYVHEKNRLLLQQQYIDKSTKNSTK